MVNRTEDFEKRLAALQDANTSVAELRAFLAELMAAYRDIEVLHRALDEDHRMKSQLLDQIIKQRCELERLCKEDCLTGLYNRRSLESFLDTELQRARRYGHGLVVVMADIDHFKRINDDFSHRAGDAVLLTIARMLRESCRVMDLVARWGGDEFVMVLPETTVAGAAVLCERIRKNIEEYNWQPVQEGMRVTVSFGISGNNEVKHPEELVQEADDRLHRAKNEGRNRVCS